MTALRDRLTGFTGKISSRLDEIIAESEAGLAQMRAADPENHRAYCNALSGITARVRQLMTKLSDTFSDQIVDKFIDADDLPWASRAFGVAQLDMEHRFTAFEMKAQRQFGEGLREIAARQSAEPVGCTECGAPLAVPNRHDAHTIQCGACGSQNQVQVLMSAATFRGVIAHYAAGEVAFPKRKEIDQWRLEMELGFEQHRKPESLESFEQWHAQELAYWRIYAQAKADLLGEPVDQSLIDAKMQGFRRFNLEQNQVWARKHGSSW